MRLVLVLSLLAVHLLCSDGTGMRIIDGNVAVPHSRPYMALITFEINGREKICGGSLIHPRWVLTAGHCHMQGSFKTVTLGAHDKDKNEREQQLFHIFKSVTHPQYNSTYYFNDLKLYKLPRAATLTKAVQLLPLPKTFDDLKEGTVCDTAGWGKTKVAEDSNKLLEVNVTVLNRKGCAEYYISKKKKITENMMCTKVGPEGQDTCAGDSGGPLICNGIFSGMTSFGPVECGKAKQASVFTRLTKEYISWIQSQISRV